MRSRSSSADKDSAYSFEFKSITDGKPISLSSLRGKVVLIVNVASRCHFTTQYTELERLYRTYKNQGFIILGVPSNDFGDQERGNNAEIAKFCRMNYSVTFPITQKEHVRSSNAHPFYKWARDQFGFFGKPFWNFHKYLIDPQGNLVDFFYSTTSPSSYRIRSKIEKLLKKKGNKK